MSTSETLPDNPLAARLSGPSGLGGTLLSLLPLRLNVLIGTTSVRLRRRRVPLVDLPTRGEELDRIAVYREHNLP